MWKYLLREPLQSCVGKNKLHDLTGIFFNTYVSGTKVENVGEVQGKQSVKSPPARENRLRSGFLLW